MMSTYEQRLSDARKIDQQLSTGADKIVARSKFGEVAKVLWRDNTAAVVATIGNASVRTAERWLAGEFEPPFAVLATMFETFKRS